MPGNIGWQGLVIIVLVLLVVFGPKRLPELGRSLGHDDGELPNAERIARETVALPLHTRMSEQDVDRVCDACAEVIAENHK